MDLETGFNLGRRGGYHAWGWRGEREREGVAGVTAVDLHRGQDRRLELPVVHRLRPARSSNPSVSARHCVMLRLFSLRHNLGYSFALEETGRLCSHRRKRR
eukprot:299235-Amorphochlora_amoeboformis.AAC.2